jgi:2-methylcitrate dehydratase PrpD
MTDSQPSPGLTAQIAATAAGLQYADLPAGAVEVVRQCVLDTLGVAIAGSDDTVTAKLRKLCLVEGGAPVAPLLWQGGRLSRRQAALVNGTSAHALDYDDNNLTMPGHVSAVVLPAALAAAAGRRASGRDLVTAFAAGFEAACSIGATIAPGHYARGFHATGTNGSLGAAVASARMAGLDARRTAHALSIATTMAAGLKGLFGTMCKPFHAGRGAENGVLAALLAEDGFDARGDALECRQGYADTHAPSFDPSLSLLRPEGGWHLYDNLFKFHAACYGTHGAIECGLGLARQPGVATGAIRSLVLEVSEDNDKTCNIALPVSEAEARFSQRHVVGMALAGHDTASATAYGNRSLGDAEVARLRGATEVRLLPGLNIAHSFLTLRMADGQSHRIEVNAGLPSRDLAAQRERLAAKFRVLVEPVAGQAHCGEMLDAILGIERLDDLEELLQLCQRRAT